MIRFLIDIFWFPLFPSSPKNKFGTVIRFLFKDFPAYFYSKPTFLKVFLLPFLVLHLILKKTKYETFGTFGQLVIAFLFVGMGYIGYGLYKYDYDVILFANKTCLHNEITLEICYQGGKIIKYPFIGDRLYEKTKQKYIAE